MNEMTWGEASAKANAMECGRYSMEWQIEGLPTQVRQVYVERNDRGVMSWYWASDLGKGDKVMFDLSVAIRSGTVFRSLVDTVSDVFSFVWELQCSPPSEWMDSRKLVAVMLERKRAGEESLVFIQAKGRGRSEYDAMLYFSDGKFDNMVNIEGYPLSKILTDELNHLLSETEYEDAQSVDAASAGSVTVDVFLVGSGLS